MGTTINNNMSIQRLNPHYTESTPPLIPQVPFSRCKINDRMVCRLLRNPHGRRLRDQTRSKVMEKTITHNNGPTALHTRHDPIHRREEMHMLLEA